MSARILRGRRESGSVPVVLASLVLAVCWRVGLAEAAKAAKTINPVAVGMDWFTHKWKAHDKISRGGDGLGPMFNAKSCADCHNQGVVGGGGGLERNVQILAVELVNFRQGGKSGEAMAKQVLKIHPGLNDQPAVVMHRFGTRSAYVGWRNQRIRSVPPSNIRAPSMILASEDATPSDRLANELTILSDPLGNDRKALLLSSTRTAKVPPINMRLTERNTSAIFGDGLIDQIADAAIVGQVDGKQAVKVIDDRMINDGNSNRPQIVGKVARLSDGRVGKFGWKAQHATLAEFTATACAVEVGLEVPGHEQGANPQSPSYEAPGFDMNRRDVDNLVAFVSSLPAPRQIVPEFVKPETVSHGEVLFDRIGCTDCHVKKLGGVEAIYSDLLVHDMGGSFGDVGYFNMFVSDFAKNGANRQQPDPQKQVAATEWRTPPLWGVADSASYMHDGRAATLEEAIIAHEGTANWSSAQFRQLNEQDQAAVLWFLQSLRAPSLRQIATTVARAEPKAAW